MSHTALSLTPEEQAMLAGEAGPGVRRAMEIVVALGRIYGAADLVPVASVQVSGVSYKNLGDAGLEFLQEWAAQGARARVPATLNPAGMDRLAWRELGFSETFARRQEAVIAAYEGLGIQPTCTCTPYHIGHEPQFGRHLAWAESSAVSYANSVLGARTNREGGPSALAAAITGRTARYGLHLDENRQATALVDVRSPIRSQADLGVLGYLVGKQVKNGVPYFRFRRLSFVRETMRRVGPAGLFESFNALGAAMAAAGAVALFHLEDLTPEVVLGTTREPARGVPHIVVDDLAPGYAALNGPATAIDMVSIGCPHASLREIQFVARALAGRRVAAALWITTSRAVRDAAQARGLVARLENCGARAVADTCLVVAPVAELGFRSLATNSAKMAVYAPSHSGVSVRYGPLEQCLEAAVTGRWPASG